MTIGTDARAAYDAYAAKGLKLNMQRGQPADADFDLSNEMLTALTPGNVLIDGFDVRNYSGNTVAGLPSARALFAEYLDLAPENVLVWNNASLELQAMVFTFALLHGLPASPGPWFGQDAAIIVTTPGYDRHFSLLEALGLRMIPTPITPHGPDVETIAGLAAADPTVRGVLFVPTYSNPTGDSITPDAARRLAGMPTAAADFTIFADDA